MDVLLILPIAVVLIATSVATFTDVRRFRIYNNLTLPLLASGLIYHATFAQTTGLLMSIAGACFGGGALLVLYLMGGMGAGDVKLMAGVGAWLGLPAVFYVLIASSLAAGAYAMLILAVHGGVGRTVTNFQVIYYQIRAIGAHFGPEERSDSLAQCRDSHRVIPYGPMIAVGVIAWIIWRGATI